MHTKLEPKRHGRKPVTTWLLPLLLAAGLAQAATPAAPPAVASAATATPTVAAQPAPAAAGAVKLDGLDANEQELFWRAAKGELCPCGQPTSLARCLAAEPCARAVAVGQRLAGWVSEGLGYHQLMDRLIGVMEEQARTRTFDLEGVACEGAANPVVRLVSYSDFQCPYCREAGKLVRELVAAHPDKISYCFKHFPLSQHLDARYAATVGELLTEKGKFWEFHDQIFKAAEQDELNEAKIKQIAASLGLKLDASASASLQAASARVDRHLQEGRENGVSGTPSFYVNGRPTPRDEPLSESLPRMVKEELEGPH